MLKVNVNIELFKKILELHPQKVDEIQKKFNNYNYWLIGSDKPTYNQLDQLSNYLKIPFGYFFLKEFQKQEFPITHYRNVNDRPFEPSQEFIDTIKIIQTRQEWLKDILTEYGHTKLTFSGCVNLDTDIKQTVQSIKENLDLIDFKAIDFENWQSVFIYLIQQTEKAGICTVINGIVGNDTHRKLNVDEFRGFVLTDDIAPFIFINNNDAKSAQIFTLAHELAHIWLGESASFELRNLQAADYQIEKYCNSVAAELLVPEEELKKQFSKNENIKYLSNYFKVSQIVIARRLLDLNQIDKTDFFNFYENRFNKEKIKSKSKGGDFYNTVPYRISRKFGEIIYRATIEGKISYRDAFKLTGLRAKTFDNYFKEYRK